MEPLKDTVTRLAKELQRKHKVKEDKRRQYEELKKEFGG